MKKSVQPEKKTYSRQISNEPASKKEPDRISSFGISDNRPQTAAQRRLLDDARNSGKNNHGPGGAQPLHSGPGVIQLMRIDKENMPRDPERAKMVLEWIGQVKDLILMGKYADAYNKLTNRTGAKKLGVGLNLKEGLIIKGPGKVVPPENFYHSNINQIELKITPTKIVPGEMPNFLPDWLNDETIAGIVLPTYLEEYMHYYQALTNTFWSENTEAFKQQSGLKDKSVDLKTGEADYDEVDILAKLADWGFDVEKIGYIERYPERVKYWDWHKQRQH